jgi:DNA polymerase-3 subunit alpha
LKVFVESEPALSAVANILANATAQARRAARGPVQLCLMTGDGEIEIDTGSDYAVSPEIKGAIKALNGVMAVEDI